MAQTTRYTFRIGLGALAFVTFHQFLLIGKLTTHSAALTSENGGRANVHRSSFQRHRTTLEETSALRLTELNYTESLKHGIVARAFQPWPDMSPLPCFAPFKKQQYTRPVTPSDVHQGFLFMKLMKTGGSTAAGINIRIMQQVAKARNETFQYCQGRFEHAWGYEMLQDRVRQGSSFTWTIVREPTKRAISQFFHFKVSRENVTVNDYQFQSYLRSERRILLNHFIQVLNNVETSPRVPDAKAPALINKVFNEYDFIGVTERMDESAVALMMILGVPMGSILYLNAKGNGGYDDGGYMRTCFYIQPSHVSKGMKKFFNGREWKEVVKWDEAFYYAANRSLDLTIASLGREAFQKHLIQFRNAQKLAQERCLPREVFPCTSNGTRNTKKSCLWKDSACGSTCLNEVASELGLWVANKPHPISYSYTT